MSIVIAVTYFSFFYLKDTISIKNFNKEIQIHTKLQTDYLNDNFYLASEYAKGDKELSKPQALKLAWNMNPFQQIFVERYEISIATNEKMDNAQVVTVSGKNEYQLYNLMTATTYFCKVNAFNSNGKVIQSDVKSFKTSDSLPRNINIEGVTNARDLGGYALSNGKRFKQGMIYRTARLNENDSEKVLITESGIKTMVQQLKVKTEIDLRKTDEVGGITASVLGDSVNYCHIPMLSNGNILRLNKTETKMFFEVLADKNNYPLFFHCSIGTDRTGAMAFLLESLLGVCENDIYTDYLFSNFGLIGSPRFDSAITNYINEMQIYDKPTLQENVYAYLNQKIGVSEQDLDLIISNLTE